MKCAGQVTTDGLQNICQEMERRLDKCRITNGAYVETYYFQNYFRHILK
jgi:hypothetical protein